MKWESLLLQQMKVEVDKKKLQAKILKLQQQLNDGETR
jgi:hypothetical protein